MILAGDRNKKIMDRNPTMDQGNLNDNLEVVREIVAHFHQLYVHWDQSKRACLYCSLIECLLLILMWCVYLCRVVAEL